MFNYSIYGLRLACDTALPELESASSEEAVISIVVRLHAGVPCDTRTPRWILRSTLSNNDDWALCGKVEGGYLLRYPGFAEFSVDQAGTDLRCTRVEAATSRATLRHLLLDQVLPLVLNLLRRDVFHATAVATPAGVCAFIGPAGTGKSTLAASFAAAGYRTFCDDCLVVRRDREILCTPGYPGLRLRSDSFTALGNHPVKLSEVADYTSKWRITSSTGLPADGLPLIAIYSIRRQSDDEPELSAPRTEPLRGHEAFMELVLSAYVLDVSDPATLLRHFQGIQELLARVPLRRLRMPTDFALLPAARGAILNEIESLNSSGELQTGQL